MQEQNAETSGSEMPETREDFDRMEREMEQQAATELGIQRERAEASGEGGTYSEASEAMIDSVQSSSDADAEVEFLHAQGEGTVDSEEPQEVDFSTLSPEDQVSVLFSGLVELNTRLTEVEQRLILLAQSFVRILEAAGMAEEGAAPEPPPIEVARTMPAMATKIKPR